MDNIQCQYHFPPKNAEDSTQETPILRNLNDLLRSPYPPSPADIQQIQSYIEREFKRCNQEITSGQLEPSTHTERCRSLLAPIRKLPNEILENIFAMTCLAEYGCYSLRVYDAPKHERLPHIAPTLTLTHVSYRWRLLVNTSARLWSSIKVEITGLTKDRMNVESLLELYLTRSKEYPLDLRFWQYPGYNDSSIASMICPHIPRITKLDLCTETSDSSDALYVPNLDQLWDDFRTKAPRLSSGVKTVQHLKWFNWVPYHQLAVLEIREVYDCRDLIRMIQLCTRLHTLKLSILPNATHADNSNLRIEAPSVHHLSVGVYHNELSFISEQIGFPSLVSLEISPRRSRKTISLAPLIAAASGYRLRKFVLKAYRGSQSDVTTELCQFLMACPELSEIQVCCLDVYMNLRGPWNEYTLTYQLLEMLCQAPQEDLGVVLPRLTELSIFERDSYLDLATVSSLLDMLETRSDNSTLVSRSTWDISFRQVTVWKKDGWEVFHAKLESLKRRGVVCRIQWERVLVEEEDD